MPPLEGASDSSVPTRPAATTGTTSATPTEPAAATGAPASVEEAAATVVAPRASEPAVAAAPAETASTPAATGAVESTAEMAAAGSSEPASLTTPIASEVVATAVSPRSDVSVARDGATTDGWSSRWIAAAGASLILAVALLGWRRRRGASDRRPPEALFTSPGGIDHPPVQSKAKPAGSAQGRSTVDPDDVPGGIEVSWPSDPEAVQAEANPFIPAEVPESRAEAELGQPMPRPEQPFVDNGPWSEVQNASAQTATDHDQSLSARLAQAQELLRQGHHEEAGRSARELLDLCDQLEAELAALNRQMQQ